MTAKSRPETHDTPPSESRPDEYGHGDSSLYERMVPEGIKQRVETLLKDGKLKHVVSDFKLPGEIVSHILHQVDETKQAAIKEVGKETRRFLQNLSLSDEMAKLLTQVSLQVKTDIRFVPREESPETGEQPAKPDQADDTGHTPKN